MKTMRLHMSEKSSGIIIENSEQVVPLGHLVLSRDVPQFFVGDGVHNFASLTRFSGVDPLSEGDGSVGDN